MKKLIALAILIAFTTPAIVALKGAEAIAF
jgi:hypothetical protein